MKRKGKKVLGTVGLHVLIAAISLAFAFPLLWMFMTSFKTPREYYSMPPRFLPNQFVIFHYKEAFAPWTINPTELSEATYYIEESAGRVESVVPNIGNSLIIITGSVGLALLVGIWGAYALSRFSFRGGENMGVWILSTRMMPPIVIAIPLFWVMRRIHLTGTHLGLIMIYVMIQLPFVIWMMKGFFDEIPRSIEESVLVDGGTRLTVMPSCSHWLLARPHRVHSHLDLHGQTRAIGSLPRAAYSAIRSRGEAMCSLRHLGQRLGECRWRASRPLKTKPQSRQGRVSLRETHGHAGHSVVRAGAHRRQPPMAAP